MIEDKQQPEKESIFGDVTSYKHGNIDLKRPGEIIEQYKHTLASKKPRYSLIPKAALDALADRFELGQQKYKDKSWNALTKQDGLLDDAWVIARAEHVIYHAMLIIQKMNGLIPDDGDDDAAAIMWGGTCLHEARRIREGNKEPQELPERD
jgi:hypothetical protein